MPIKFKTASKGRASINKHYSCLDALIVKYLSLITVAGCVLLSACSPSSTPEVAVIPPVIAPQLELDVLDAIVLGDGAMPVVSGSWPRFAPDISWNWQLQGDVDTSFDVDVFVLDMFQMFEGNVIETLHAQNKHVICYFSAGTFEPWCPDAGLFEEAMFGNEHFAYDNERWLDITSERTRKIMVNRMDMAQALGCDGVDLDNVDGFTADTGLGITLEQELEYLKVLANEAHKRNLTVVMNNAIEAIPEVVDYFDLAINELCYSLDECETYTAMIAAGKPVFHVEYEQSFVNDSMARAEMCAQSATQNIRTLVVPRLLDGSYRLSCDQ